MMRAQFEGALYFASVYAACVVYSRRGLSEGRELFEEIRYNIGSYYYYNVYLLYQVVLNLYFQWLLLCNTLNNN